MIKQIEIKVWKNFLDKNNSGLCTNIFPYTYGCSRYLTNFFTDGFYFALAFYKNSNIISSCLFQSCSSSVMVLRGMFTLPVYQRQGYAKKLLNFGADALKMHNLKKIWASCRAENLPFYKKCDFSIDHEWWPPSPCFEIQDGNFIQLPTTNHYIYKNLI